MNIKNTIKKAVIIGAIALAGAKGIQAQEAPKGTLKVEASSTAEGLPADALLANQFRTIATYDGFKIGLEYNDGKTFGDSKFGSVSYATKLAGWDVEPGVRIYGAGDTIKEFGVYTGKTFGNSRLNLFAAVDDHDFRVIRGWQSNIADMVDVGVGMKITAGGIGHKAADGSRSSAKPDFLLGVHAADGSSGIWASKSIDNSYGGAVTIDKPDFGLYAFGKHNIDARFDFAVAQLTFGNDGKRIGGQNNASNGLPTARVTGSQVVHPGIGNQPSSLLSGGQYSAELAYVNNKGKQYEQAQFGARIITFSDGTSVYTGGGLRYDGKAKPVGELAVKSHGLNLSVRASPKLSVSTLYTAKF